jgi:hypothetical protein
MKKIFPLFCVLYLISTTPIFGQFLDLSIPSGELPSDISSWGKDPKLMTISFAVPDGIKVDKGHIIFEVTAGPEQILASTRSKFADQPEISGTFKKKNFTFTSVVNLESIDIDSSPKSLISRDGKLPAGFFGLCFYLVDADGKPVKEIFQGCTNFFVRDIDPPTLLTPANEAIVSAHSPLSFSWTPAKVTTQQIHYQLKLFPVYSGQTVFQAMSSSSAFYKSDDIFSTTFTYPTDAPPLNSIPNVIGFAWVVTQMDQSGKTIGKNYGRSNPAIFYKKAE